MSRFAYIPLDFDNIDLGIERELSLDKANKDLYILDDYKVPVSVTHTLRQEITDKDEVAKKLFNDLDELEFTYKEYLKRLNNLGYDIDKLIYETESNLFSRIDNLENYKNYLKDRYDQFYESYTNIKNYLSKTLNTYKENVEALLNLLKIRYNSAKNKYDKYVIYENEYITKITEMENEIKKLKELLELKLNKLGAGQGSFSGQKTVSKTVGGIFIGWFYWMSNNPTIYPGRGAWSRFSTSPPATPRDFCGGVLTNRSRATWYKRVIQYPTEAFNSVEAAVDFFKTGSTLVSVYWIGGVESNGYISETGIFNQYAKKCAVKYSKNITVSTTEKFNYNVT